VQNRHRSKFQPKQSTIKKKGRDGSDDEEDEGD